MHGSSIERKDAREMTADVWLLIRSIASVSELVLENQNATRLAKKVARTHNGPSTAADGLAHDFVAVPCSLQC